MKKRTQPHLSLRLAAGAMVLLIAALAGGSLWALRRLHKELAHVSATRSVIERGRSIAGQLAYQPVLSADGGEEADWQRFAELVNTLYTLEPALQFIAVSRDGVVVFQQQREALAAGVAEASDPGAATADVVLSQRLLSVAGGTLPVVVFTLPVDAAGGESGVIEVAMRREAVALEERAATDAIGSMFRVSLVTVVIAFAACGAMVVWLMRREERREQVRREQEHLAFAGVMASGIAHDFRNPMSSLKLDVQMIGREAARGADLRRERVTQLARRVAGTVERMDKVFQEFFYLGKPVDETRLTRVDLRRCLDDCLTILEPRFEKAGVGVDRALGDEELVVMADEPSLTRALMNVITNAKQFSPAGAHVRITAGAAGRHVDLHVMDRGPGVPDKERKRIFEMFVSSRPGGTGLGLFLARTALERSGGHISVSDRPDGGADFHIRLNKAE